MRVYLLSKVEPKPKCGIKESTIIYTNIKSITKNKKKGNLIKARQPRDTNQSLSLVAAAIRDILMSGVRREESTFLGCGKSEEFGNGKRICHLIFCKSQ